MRQLDYDLSGFDFMAAGALLQRRIFPARIKVQAYFIWVAMFLGLVTLFFGVFREDVAITLTGCIALGATGALMVALRGRVARMMNALVGASPLLSGPSRLTLTDEGLAFENADCRTLYRWSGLRDVLAHGDGILVVMGAIHYLPLPARAFADLAERDAVISEIRLRAPALTAQHQDPLP